MTSYVPVVKNSANGAILYVGLVSQANTKVFQANPTLTTGDIKYSLDGGALTNLPTFTVAPAAGKMVKLTLTQSEVNADNITLVLSDAAGAEWCDRIINIQTVTRQIDDLAFPTVSGRSISTSTVGTVGIDWSNVSSPTTTLSLTNTTMSATQVVASVTGAVGSVTGAVGSVTGAVGSVTGNVGGNVVGSVASVTGNVGGDVVGSVGSVVGNVGGSVASVAGNVGGNVVGTVASVVGNVSGNVVGSVGSVAGNVAGNVVGSVGSISNPASIFTTTMSESYAALGAAPTLAQAVFEVRAILAENNVTGTIVTIRKIDGSTTAETFTINSATVPTNITRAS